MIRIQMIGTQRSGSNLLRLMLDSGGAVLAPPSAHELQDLLPLTGAYEPLGEPLNQERLARDLVALVEANALAWPDGSLDVGRLLEELRGLTVAHFVVALYDQAAKQASRRGWVSKCLENVHLAGELEQTGTLPKYVHLVRDPRDVALSFSRAPIGPKDPRAIAAAWCRDQAAGAAIAKRVGARFHRLRFEDLVQDPEAVLGDLSTWAGIPLSASALGYHERADAAAAAAMSPLWANLGRRPLAERVSAHLRETGYDDFLETVEAMTFDTMQEHGYEPRLATAARAMSLEEAEAARVADARLRRAAAQNDADRDQSAHRRREDLLVLLRDRGRRG